MGETPRFVKICGVTRVEDAVFAVEAGADAIGVNLVPASKRCVSENVARSVAEAVRDRAMVVAVVADLPIDRLRQLRRSTGIGWVQLHGDEPPAFLTELLPHAFKAVRIGGPSDVERARSFAGDRLLVDAKVTGRIGGTGETFDWALVRELAAARRLILAGGLSPDNVSEAIRTLDPFGVDVASGVEREPGVKDPEKVRAFIRAARSPEQT